jgi:ubiquitin-conjugating enzyme E2 Q
VSQLDWIQTRYLFVQLLKPYDPAAAEAAARAATAVQNIVTTPTTTTVSGVKLDSSMIHPQDPRYTPRNMQGLQLIIPATPTTRKRLSAAATDGDVEMMDAPPLQDYPSTTRTKVVSKKRKKDKTGFSSAVNLFSPAKGGLAVELDNEQDDVSVATDTEDLMVLLSDDEESEAPVVEDKKGKGKAKKKPTRLDEFIPGALNTENIQFLAPPSYASPMASKRLNSDLQSLIKLQESQPLDELGFYINPDHVDNVYQWIVELHSFPEHLPLVKDMRQKSPVLRSIVLEIRFGPQYPMSPPFVRVVQPRFLGFAQGGGGNVTLGGAMCMELLTNTGWSAVSTVESVLMQVRMALMDEEHPARLVKGPVAAYGVAEAVEAFRRACRNHGWKEPEGIDAFLSLA